MGIQPPSSIFIGVPLSDQIFNTPISAYLTPGFVFHYSSDVQEQTTEYVLAIKFFYTFQWPTRWRLGFAEGLSYAAKVPYVEKDKFGDETNGASRLMNYLDVSVDVDLGSLFGMDSMKDLWLGWGIHHRSGIFGQSSAFNEISGGSNYNYIHLRRHW